ncbi:hypothetical protein [Streptomyces violarus]|uniref:hypothetical protein n=1 Tax=Streptomyces violarus TaxID=67380 RepID=UPI0021C140C7|nr:hypothetical protein [Streptomyces violarus]MCT9140353.1 hypothetical protein [Streptomyces violarus]
MARLTPAQLDGIACIVCADEDGAMTPVGTVDGCQVFAHRACVDDETTPALFGPAFLVVGPVETADDVDNLRGYAMDVATELGAPTVYATHSDYSVTDFEAVFLLGSVTELRDAPTLVLVAEALAAGVQVLEPQSPQMAATCDECGQVQTVRTVTDEYGDTLCASCREEVTCAWCTEASDATMETVERGEMWVPAHAACASGVVPVAA